MAFATEFTGDMEMSNLRGMGGPDQWGLLLHWHGMPPEKGEKGSVHCRSTEDVGAW